MKGPTFSEEFNVTRNTFVCPILILPTFLQQLNILVGDTEKSAIGQPNTRAFKLDAKLHSMISSHSPHQATSIAGEFKELLELQRQYCDSLLNNKGLMEGFRSADLIIGDSLYPCSSLIADIFSLPHVIIGSLHAPIACGVHNPPSYVPNPLLGHSGSLGFFHRIQNTILWLGSQAFFHFIICPFYEEIKVRHNIAPNKSIRETLGRVDLIIGQVDFPIEAPRPLLPSKYLEIL